MKLSGIITVPFHIGDFLSGTMHMDTLEKGAYIMLLLAHYQAGETGLPNDDKKLARIAGVTPKVWDRIKPIVVEKFTENGDFLFQKVVVECLRKVHEKSSKQRTKALKKHGVGDATAEPRQCQPKPKPKPKDNTNVLSPPISPKGSTVYSPQFEDFWSVYPNRTGKAAAFKSYRSAIKNYGVNHEYLLDRARQFAEAHRRAGTPSQYIPHPTTWLNQGRWEDDLGGIGPRPDPTRPAPNARGSQFSAVLAAAAELMQEGDMDVQGRPPGLSEWGHSPGLEVRPSGGNERTGLPAIAHRDNSASRQTIDHDATDTADG